MKKFITGCAALILIVLLFSAITINGRNKNIVPDKSIPEKNEAGKSGLKVGSTLGYDPVRKKFIVVSQKVNSTESNSLKNRLVFGLPEYAPC